MKKLKKKFKKKKKTNNFFHFLEKNFSFKKIILKPI